MKKFPRVRVILIGLSAALNILVLGGAAWLATGGAVSVARAYIVDPQYERRTSQWDALPIKAEDTVFLGDSLTEFGDWDELFPESSVKNRGIAGDDTAGVLRRLDQVTSAHPRQIFLMIGTNDLAAGDSEEQIVSNFEEILRRIHAESSNTELYVQAVLPRAEGYRSRVESLNGSFREAAEEHGDAFVDLYPLFLHEDGSIANRYSNDEVHLLGSGYLLWRDALTPYVKRRS